VYERVTKGIIERLEAGVAPWHKPWDPVFGRPRNLVSGRPYNGVNALALGMSGRPPGWLTIKQVNAMGLRVRKASKGVPILYAKKSTVREKDESGEEVERERFLMRFYFVFNQEDVEGLKVDHPVVEPAPGVEAAEAILAAVQPKPDIRSGDQAYFTPAADTVTLPPKAAFGRVESYYATTFHELTHWTGHASRLNRETITTAAPFGSQVYSQEELVAEVGAGFLCALAGVENQTIDQSASYLDHWLRALKADPGMIVRSAAQAQKAVDFLAPEGGNPDGQKLEAVDGEMPAETVAS
jgi:antirestriction protein ArdC